MQHLRTSQRPAKHDETPSRGHVRPAGEPRRSRRKSAGRKSAEPPRPMLPRSQAVASTPSARQARRSERRARREQQVQVARRPRRRARFRPGRYLTWRAVSGMLTLGLAVVLYLCLTADAFFVNSVAIGGVKYLTREEVFRYSGIAQKHVFWVDPEDVASRLETVPNIADAQVYIGWPPDMVQIVITEREPALIWEQSVRVWVDVNGIVMRQREDRPDLLRIVVPNSTETIDVGARIPQTIVDGALQLRNRHPNIDVLLYDSIKGLGFHDGGGWTVWFGTGEEMDVKLTVYYRVVESILAQRIQPGEIMMTDPDRPSYTILWREGE